MEKIFLFHKEGEPIL